MGSSPIARPSSPNLCALVLAGGAARRMGGGDKPLLDVGGKPMLARILGALATQAASVAISANGDPARFAGYGVPVLADGDFVGCGPLAGVLAGLEWACAQGGDVLLTVPGDTPFVPECLAVALAPGPACAASGGRVHPLVALWPVSARAELRRTLSAGESLGARRFGARLGTRVVEFPATAGDPFFNVNTEADLATARLRSG